MENVGSPFDTCTRKSTEKHCKKRVPITSRTLSMNNDAVWPFRKYQFVSLSRIPLRESNEIIIFNKSKRIIWKGNRGLGPIQLSS